MLSVRKTSNLEMGASETSLSHLVINVRVSNLQLSCVSFVNVSLTAATEGLVTAWSRPYRHPDYTGTLDAIYLAMENGGIYYLELDGSAHALVQNAVKASYLDCAIGTAFTALDCGLGSNDMIVAGGEMSSGGIYLVGRTRCDC